MKLLLTGIVLLALVNNGLSLTCYECSNCENNDKQCSDNKPSCFKSEVSQGENKIVNKGCGLPIGLPLMGDPENTCKTLSVLGVETFICTCLTDLCNNANVHMQSSFVIFPLIIVAIFIQSM